MAHEPEIADPAPPEASVSLRARFSQRVARVTDWATATRLRIAISSMVGLVALGVFFASWSYMAHLAVEANQPMTLVMALTALEEGRDAEAKSIIGDMQELPAGPDLLGGAMYILGALKVREAEKDPSSVRGTALYQMAARYLQQARTLGPPEQHQGRAALLLGKSLAGSGQMQEAIAPLEDALADPSLPPSEIHALLVRALLDAPDPDFNAALKHNELVLADASLAPEELERAWMLQAETLLRGNRMAEARAALEHVSAQGPLAALRLLLAARLKIDQARQLPEDSSERKSQLDAAMGQLREVQHIDARGSDLTRQTWYWIARCHELRGDIASALEEYGNLSKTYGDTPEGLTATLAQADYLRAEGQTDRALAGYRVLLQAISDPDAYNNPLMPLNELHRSLTKAYQQLVNDEHFEKALSLVDMMEPVFGATTCMELRAKTHQQWGDNRFAHAATLDRWDVAAPHQEGRYHLRSGGKAYEELAQLRFGTRNYTEDLWAAADCYFRGQSYTNAGRVLESYLHHDAERRNAMALLRLGQSRLAGKDVMRAIDAFEECVELYPREASAFQARLECARAYDQSGKPTEGEQLLKLNLSSEALSPASPEWKDSKFALGNLLYEQGRFEEAITTLQEAVMRYPADEASLLAQYTMARAYHCASEAPGRRMREAKTETERQSNRKLLTDNLTLAHAAYQDVQRTITLRGHTESDPLDRTLLRNCYMMQGSVLFELRRFEEARQAYGAVITRYQNDPIVLESFVQVANCWRRLEQPVKARVTLDQAKMVLNRLPADADFLASTNFNREQWELLLSQMSQW